MKNINIIKACSDLGVHKNGTHLGPDIIMENIKDIASTNVYRLEKSDCKKELDQNNKKKNLKHIKEFNNRLYKTVSNVLTSNNTPLTIGGDHSIAIATALASIKKWRNLGIIWIDAHSDYHTFETTVTGNIHGLPLATITGQDCNDLCKFHNGAFYNPKNTVIVGARSIDYPGEYINLEKAGVTVFTIEDVKKEGIENILEKSIEIASTNTEGIHMSLDVDVLDPDIAPGVSVPEVDGINEDEFYTVIDKINEHQNIIKSIDLVEYNPKYDVENKTLNIVTKALKKLLYNENSRTLRKHFSFRT